MIDQNQFAKYFGCLVPVLVCVLFFHPCNSHAEEKVVLDFGDSVPGDSLPTVVGSAHLMELHSPRIEFLTPDSSPPSPFPDGVHGLLVDPEENAEARVRIRLRPFLESPPPKVGWIELEMVVNSATHNGLDIGVGGMPGVASSEHPVYDGAVILGLNLNVDKPVDALIYPTESKKVNHQAVPSPELGVPFRLRISWDFSQDVPTIQLSINGNVLQDPTGNDLLLEVPDAQFEEGVDYLSLLLRNGIIGRIFASE